MPRTHWMEVSDMPRCEYKGCTNESDYYCTDTHKYACHDHIYLDEEE